MDSQDRGVLPEEMRHTYSVCPVCLKRIPAKREERDGQIYLVKTCPDHGTFSSVIWRNKRKFADWRGERPAVGENENLDIHVYSIDEVFIDLTGYLTNYQMGAKELISKVIQDVLKETGITATAGIGTNLYLAKIAMDITGRSNGSPAA